MAENRAFFYEALIEGYLADVKALLEGYGSRPDESGEKAIDQQFGNGFTALTVAAFYGHDKIVELLLDHGAKIDLKDSADDTPLANACLKGHKKVIILLLHRGAALDDIDRCIEDLQRIQRPELAELLQKEPERRRLVAEAKQRARKAAFNVFTKGLDKNLRRPKLKLKLRQKRGPG